MSEFHYSKDGDQMTIIFLWNSDPTETMVSGGQKCVAFLCHDQEPLFFLIGGS